MKRTSSGKESNADGANFFATDSVPISNEFLCKLMLFTVMQGECTSVQDNWERGHFRLAGGAKPTNILGDSNYMLSK